MMKSNKPLNHVSCSIEEHSFLESLKEPRNNVYAGLYGYTYKLNKEQRYMR